MNVNISDRTHLGIAYTITPRLRYVKKEIYQDDPPHKHPELMIYGLRLQQMWQGNDGSELWEWVPEVEL